jgi:integrase/recombinase XerD
MPSVQVDYNDPAYQRWMNTITRTSTQRQYKCSWKSYVAFTHRNATELIREAVEDEQRGILDKRDIVTQHLLAFYHWLTTKAPVYQRGGSGKIVSHGLSSKTANARVSTIRSFYATFGISVRLKGRSQLPKPKIRNKRMRVEANEVRVLLQHVTSLRDRAIILSMFQSGMDVSTLCTLNYGHVKQGIVTNERPLKLTLHREKTGVDYYTFLGTDAISAIQAYLREMRQKGITFTERTPLFLKAVYTRKRGDTIRQVRERVTTKAIQKMMREAARHSPLVDDTNNGKDFNPLSPHALREGFSSIMTNKGVTDTIIDFWLGHSIGEMADAYKRVQLDDLRRMYAEREIFLSVSSPESAIEERVKEQLNEQQTQLEQQFSDNTQKLQILVNGLATKNLALEFKLHQMERSLAEQQQDLHRYQQRMEYLFKQALPSYIDSTELRNIIEAYLDQKLGELHTQLKRIPTNS